MDWLNRIEEERRQKADAEHQATERRYREAEEVRSSLAAIEERLRPTLSPLVDDISRKLGLQLKVHRSATELTISAPNPPRSNLVNEHRIIISQSRSNTRLRITAIRADQIHRDTEYKPADMTLAEWRGADETVVQGDTTIEYLLHSDLQLLMEWLVKAALDERGRAPIPRIRTIPVRQRKPIRMSFGKALFLGLVVLAGVLTLWYYISIG
jgi:hypothetical protein